MTILPKKKTGKEKPAKEQSSHEHHSSADAHSTRVRVPSRTQAAMSDHRSSRNRHQSDLAQSDTPAVATANKVIALDLETSTSQEPCSIPETSDPIAAATERTAPLVVKRRHGRLSPHSQPYVRGKSTRTTSSAETTSASAGCSYSSANPHHTGQRSAVPPQAVMPSSGRGGRRRQRAARVGEEGNNSDDEHDPSRLRQLNQGVNFGELEQKFSQALKEVRGFYVKEMGEDGACLFRAVADQIYGDQNMHDEVRRNCMDYMMKNSDFFSNYVTEDFMTYISRKRLPSTFGNHLEMQAMAEMYNRSFEVYQYSTEPINTFQSSNITDNDPIRVSYHQNSHYNAVINPYKASVGVGLGLPSFRPGLADHTLLRSAEQASELEILEQQMLEDKLRAADWENTEEEMLREVAQKSFRDYLQQQHGSHSSQSDETTSKEPTCSYRETPNKLEAPISTKPDQENKSTDKIGESSKTTPNVLPLPNTGLSDWVDETEENVILAQIMAQSQREYYEELTRQDRDSTAATCSKYTSNS